MRSLLPSRDPATGDDLTPTEALSWFAQSIIRRWSFIGVIAVITAICFTLGGHVLGWWNYSASFLALIIESVVGIGVYNMGRRDAVILREVRALSERGAKHARRATKAAQRGEDAAKRAEEAAGRIERMADLMLDHIQRME